MSVHAYAYLLFMSLWQVSEFSFQLVILAPTLFLGEGLQVCSLSLFGLLPPEAARMLYASNNVVTMVLGNKNMSGFKWYLVSP